jgi:hypothetical protein
MDEFVMNLFEAVIAFVLFVMICGLLYGAVWLTGELWNLL